MNDSDRIIHIEYFTSISTFQSICNSSHVVIEASENYQKNSLRNRCYLASPQGKILLSVPLKKGKHSQALIRDVKIAYDFDWTTQHLRTIKTNYLRSPFFDHYYPTLEKIILSKPVFLIDLCWESFVFIKTSIKCNFSISYSLDFSLPVDNQNLYFKTKPYPQVFENITGFIPDLSMLDLLFCMGPEIKYLRAY